MNTETQALAARLARRQRWARRRKRCLIGLLLLIPLVFVLVRYGADRMIPMPGWLAGQVEKRMNAALGPDGAERIDLGGIGVMIDRQGVPRVTMRDVAMLDNAGVPIAQMDSLRAKLGGAALLKGRIALEALFLTGAKVEVTRAPDGSLNLAVGEGGAAQGTIGDLIDAVDQAFADPALAQLERIEAEDVQFVFNDHRSGRETLATGGTLTLTQEEQGLAARATIALSSDGSAPAETVVRLETRRDSPVAYLSASIGEVGAADLAGQSPAFAFLSVLDAPISGNMRAVIGPSGQIDTIDGTLQVAEGSIRPTTGTDPIPLHAGRTYFSYDRVASQVAFSEVFVDTDAASIAATGKTLLQLGENRLPEAIIGQFAFDTVRANPYNALSEPVEYTGGAADFRLRLAPFSLEIGQLVLTTDERRFQLGGKITADARGWTTALDFGLNSISHDNLLALWPVELAPRTRTWLVNNIRAATLSDVTGAVRAHPGGRPYVSLSYDFEDAEVQFLRSMPPVKRAAGHSNLSGITYSIAVESGEVEAPNGGIIDVSGTTFQVPDLREKPARVALGLALEGEIGATLSFLDLPPLELMTRAGRSPDIAEGRIAARADIGFRLAKRVALEDVDYVVEGALLDVRSDTIIPGRVLAADRMTLRASPDALEIGGPGTLDGLNFDAAWTRANMPGAGSSVEGTVELSAQFLDTFGIGLPPGSVSGRGEAVIEVGLPPNAPPDFRLRSDLAQVGMRLDALGWTKPAATPGRLEIAGRLGDTPAIETLEIEAPGLRAVGSIRLRDGGQLDRAIFSRVQAGRWFDAPVTLTGRGTAPPGVRIGGGTLDLRSAEFGGGDGGPISLSLNQLTISDGLALTDVEGSLTSTGGLSGQITGLVNGAAPINATLAPTTNGPAIRVRGADAGQVLRAAGVFSGARRGAMDLTLTPLPEPGVYDGTLSVQSIYLRDAPTVAEILSAISVIGLVEQLEGDGILFSDVDARFRLTPQQLILLQSSAVGPSMGVSLDGTYGMGTKVMDMQGVVSPIYMLNAIGSLISRNREGLFGFNFRVRGPIGNANVSVNPLSLLTPGMFREIFRRPPPTVTPSQ